MNTRPRHSIAASAIALLTLALLSGQTQRRPPSLKLGDADFTVTAWIRTRTGGVVFSLSSGGGVWGDTGKALVIRDGRIASDFCNVGIWSGRTIIADGEWHRVAWVYRNAERSLLFYVDGQPDGEATAVALPDTDGHILRIGAASPNITPPNGFTGDIDEVRLYSSSLSPAMIALDAGPTPLAYWPLEGDARDGSGGGADGIVLDASFADGKVGQCLHLDGSGAVEIVDLYASLTARFRLVNPAGLRDAIAGRVRRLGARYPDARSRLAEAERISGQYAAILAGLQAHDPDAGRAAQRVVAVQRG
jgi:hypothetical protein